MIFEVLRCSDASKKDGDPECKPRKLMRLADGSSDELFTIEQLQNDGADLDMYEEDLNADTINNFVRNKKFAMKIINQKIMFEDFGDYSVRYNEIFAPSVALGKEYSDCGYRFRYNKFIKTDGWLLKDDDEDIFFDYFEYSKDEYDLAPVGEENMIYGGYIRLQVDQVTHTRIVYHFFDFIGDLGGTPAILLQISGWVLGSYAAFNAMYAFTSSLYRFKSEEKVFLETESNDPNTPEITIINIPILTRYYLWTQTVFFSFLCSCCKNENHQKQLDVLDKGAENVETDFDIHQIIQTNKLLRHKIEVIKTKLNVKGDPIFDKVDPRTVIDVTEGSQTERQE